MLFALDRNIQSPSIDGCTAMEAVRPSRRAPKGIEVFHVRRKAASLNAIT